MHIFARVLLLFCLALGVTAQYPQVPADKLALAKAFAGYAATAYCDTESVKRWDCKQCVANAYSGLLYSFVGSIVQVTIVRTNISTLLKSSFVVAFGIRQSFSDISLETGTSITDSRRKITYSQALFNDYQSIKTELAGELSRYNAFFPTLPVYFVGQGRGAAAAIFAFLDYGYSRGSSAGYLYTFDAPRVVLSPISCTSEICLRYLNIDDPISETAIPASVASHFGTPRVCTLGICYDYSSSVDSAKPRIAVGFGVVKATTPKNAFLGDPKFFVCNA